MATSFDHSTGSVIGSTSGQISGQTPSQSLSQSQGHASGQFQGHATGQSPSQPTNSMQNSISNSSYNTNSGMPSHQNRNSALKHMLHIDSPAQTSFMAPRAPILSECSDYRLYLKSVYEYRRSSESTISRPYSYTTFSAAADIKSPNYLKLIIEGKRNLSDEMILKFARALRLGKAETEEFRLLVMYGQATEPMERNQHLKLLAELRAQRALEQGLIDPKNWEKVPGWLGWVLYAMADQGGVDFDPASLQKLMRVRISQDEIKQSLQKLLASGDLVADPETGAVSKGRDLIESPQDLPVALIRKLQTELIQFGIESLFRDSPKEREFGALTVALTAEEYDQVRFELRQLRKRLQKDLLLKRKSSKGERVYQLNVQLFPVTEKA
jgi:uncharacterized protein (TIGR02147 family)